MSVVIYTSDLRDQDGETTEALRLANDYLDVKRAANNVDWRDIKEWSLDQFHLDLIKSDDEEQKHLKHFNGNVSKEPLSITNASITLAGCRFPVSPGDGVFIAATASWIPGGGEGALIDHVGVAAQTNIRIDRLGGPPGAPSGTTRKAHTHQAYGGIGAVWAYRVESDSLDFNIITLMGGCAYGGNYVAKPTGAQLTVFVVSR